MDRSLGGNFFWNYLVHEEGEQYNYYLSMNPTIYKLIVTIGIAGTFLMLLAYQFPISSVLKQDVMSTWWQSNGEYFMIFVPVILLVTVGAYFMIKSISNQSQQNTWLVVDLKSKQITANNGTISIDENLSMQLVTEGDTTKAIMLHNKDEQLGVGLLNPETKLYVPPLVMQLVIEDFKTLYRIPIH